MDELRAELLKAIEEVATSTGMTAKECIRQAIEMLEQEKEKDYIKRLHYAIGGIENEDLNRQ
jgi:hypothetical protein